MIDPALALPAIDFIAWKLSCLRAAQDNQPFPPMPSPHRSELADDADGYALVPDEATQQVISALLALEAIEVAASPEGSPTTSPAAPDGLPHEGGQNG